MDTRLRLFVGMAGPSGAGKTTVAKKIQEHYGDDSCVIISSDNYYKDLRHLPREERSKVNFDHPDSIDFDLLTIHLNTLKMGLPVDIPTYDFSTHSRCNGTKRIDPKSIIIVEGILVLFPEKLAALFDIKAFVKTDLDLCLIRRIQRDVRERARTVDSVIEQYKATVRPMYVEFVEPTSKTADLIVKNNLDGLDIDIAPVIEFLQGSKCQLGSFKMKCSLTKVNGTLYHKNNSPQQNGSSVSEEMIQLNQIRLDNS